MIRLVLSNRKTKSVMALLLAAIMIFQLFSSVDWVMVAEAATPDTYTIEGTIRYSGDVDWKDAIRPLTFDCSKMKLFIQIKFTDGGVMSATRDLQSTNADGDYHLAFIHDGNGGGKFTISNIPKTYNFGSDVASVDYCQVQVSGVDFYNNVSSQNITFAGTTGAASADANMELKAKTVPLNIKTGVIGEGDETSTSFDVNVKVTNSSQNRTAEKTVCVSKAAATGETVHVPIGLNCSVSQDNKSQDNKADYTLVSYNLSYKHSGGEVNLQKDVKTLSSFKTNSVQASNIVKQYNVFIQNAAKNQKVEWKVNWIDNHSPSRPTDPTFKLQYSTNNSSFSDITTSNMASLGLTSVPMYKKVTGEIVTNDNIQSFYYDNLPNTTADGKTLYYKVVQTTNSSDYIYEYDNSIYTFYNTLKTNFRATIKWLDSDDKISTVRPGIDQIRGYLNLYSYTDKVYSKVSLSTSEIKITQNAQSKRQWDLEITKNLPQYDKNNDKIIYVLVEGELDSDGNVKNKIDTISKNGYDGEEKYSVSYYNEGATEAISDRCYAEQFIIHTSSSKYVFSANKIWKDDSDVVRPKIRVTLWRYAKKSSTDKNVNIEESARVIAKNKDNEDVILSYILKTSDKKAEDISGVTDPNKETIKFDMTTVPTLNDNYELPKYDEEGNEYIYFVMESVEDGEGNYYYESQYSKKDNSITLDKMVDNGGTITSTRRGKISVRIVKTWNVASAINDIEGSSVKFKILGKCPGETEFTEIEPIEGEAVISGFGVSKTRGSVEVLINPLNSVGKRYEKIVVNEDNITVGEESIALNYSKGDKSEFTFKIKGQARVINASGDVTEYREVLNDYKGESGELKEIGFSQQYGNGIKMYNCNIVNTITTCKQLLFTTTWEDGLEPAQQTTTLVGRSIGDDSKEIKAEIIMNPDTVTLDDETGQAKGKATVTVTFPDGTSKTEDCEFIQTGNFHSGTKWVIESVPNLPQYDSKGYLYEYKIYDVKPGEGEAPWLTGMNSNSDSATISNIKFDITGDLININKTWYDDGDESNRYPIDIELKMPVYRVTPSPTPSPSPSPSVSQAPTTSEAPTQEAETESPETPVPTIDWEYEDEDIFTVSKSLSSYNFWRDRYLFKKNFPYTMDYGKTTVTEIMKNGEEEYKSVKDEDKSSIDSEGNGTEYHTISSDRFDYDVTIERKVTKSEDSNRKLIDINVINTRVEKVDIVIKKEWIDGNNYENCRPGKVSFKLYNMIGDDNPIDVSFGPNVTPGENATFDQTTDANGICTWTYTLKNMPKYDKRGILYDYYIGELPTLYTTSDTKVSYADAKYSGTLSYNFIDNKANKSRDIYEYTCTSSRRDTIDFVIYQKWLDKSLMSKARPDMYFSLYRRVKGVAGPEAPTDTLIDSYTRQVWKEGQAGDNYNWKITFENLDKYTSLGHEYEYYVVAGINNLEGNGNGLGNRYIISYKNLEDYSDTNDKAYLGCTIENLLNDTIKVKGEKIWKNIAGFKLEDLPVPIIRLYRRLESEPETYGETAEDPHYMNTIELKGGQTHFTFDKDYNGNKLQKYNTYGEVYIYYLKENDEVIATSGKCAEGDLYKTLYANNSVINKFNIDTNKRRIIVTKKWDRNNVPVGENKYPEVKINLYRYIGVEHDKDSTENVSIGNMDLLKTEVIDPKVFEDNGGTDYEIEFDNLLIYSPRGDRYHYCIQEESIDGYETSYTSDSSFANVDGNSAIAIRDDKKIIGTEKERNKVTEADNVTHVIITNTYQPETNYKVKGKKVWNDYNNYYKLRPENIELELYRYAKEQEGYTNSVSRVKVNYTEDNLTWTGKEASSNQWQYTISDLPCYAPNGQEYTYVVKENTTNIEGFYVNNGEVSSSTYNASKEVNMNDITNRFNGSCEVRKHWIDGDNKYNFRPKSVTMKLQRKDVEIEDTDANWEDVVDPSKVDGSVITKVLTSDNVVPNTKGNSWSTTVTNLPTSIYVDSDDDGIGDKKISLQYRWVEIKIGNSSFPEGSDRIGAYTMSVIGTDNNVTEIKNSMSTTQLTVTTVWDDVDDYYQTRFNKMNVRLERTDQVAVPDASTTWNQVTDIDGKPIVLDLSSGNAMTTSDGKVVWKKTFYDLPVAREGEEGEAPVINLYYRAVQCSVDDEAGHIHPQLVNVNKNSSGYVITPTKTYNNYDDRTDYINDWTYDSDKKYNFSTITNHMITNEDENIVDGKNRVYYVQAEKKWCKDADANYYAVDIELRKSNNGGVSYTSFPSKLTKRIEKDGPAVSWMKMPAYDEDGKDLIYKLYEITTNAWYKCHTDIVTSDAEPGKIDEYTFTNVQQLDYKIKKIWSKNDRVLPTNVGQFRAKFKLQQRICEDGTWEDSLDDNGVLREREMCVNNRNSSSTSSTTYSKIPKYTLDNKRIYYRAVETKVNNVDQAANIAYVMSNPDLENGGTVYSDNDNTEVTNTLRTVSLNITMNWDDDNNHDNVRPTTAQTNKFNIDVYADYGSGYVKLSPSFYNLQWDTSTANVWKATLINMPKYTYDGKTMIKYKVVQSAVPSRYFVTETPDIPTFDDATDEYDYSLSNTLNLLVKLKKYDAVNNKGLQGTKFILYKREFNEQGYVDNAVKNMTADANGNISFEVQELGFYRLVETEAVRGYVDKLDIYGEPDYEDGRSFECAFNVNNENLRQTVNINNTNSVEGRGIYEQQSVLNTANSFTTASAPTLKPAAAVVPEIGVKSGWGSLITANGLVNKRKLGELSFSKQDDLTKTMLDGVKFELYKYANEDGTGAKEYVGDIITGNDYVCSTSGTLTVTSTGKNSKKGNVHISKLPWGKYTLKEVKALPGYALPTSEYSFVVNASTVNDTTHLNENIYIQYNGKVMTNNVLPNIKTRFDFKKLGLNNKQLKGGSFKIVSNDEDSITQSFWNVITDDISLRVNDLKPNVTVYGLPVGSYRIIETDAPYGYKYTSDVVFSIDQYGNVKNSTGTILGDKVVKMVDESIDIKIINVDEDFVTPINGSTFELTGKFATNDGSEVTDVETRSCKITSLEWFIRENILPTSKGGSSYIYKLKQTNVPAGYEDQPQEVYFIIDENYNIVLTDENGNKPSAELQEAYDIFIKVDNSDVPSIIFENLRIPKNDIYIENGEDYVDELGNILCKTFYAYDTNRYDVRLGEPIRFYIDKSNLGLLDFAITTSIDVKDTSKYVSSEDIKIYDSAGNRVQAVNNKYNLKENVNYTMYIDKGFLEDLETGSKMIYFYSHMPRIDDVEAVYIVRRTAFPRN